MIKPAVISSQSKSRIRVSRKGEVVLRTKTRANLAEPKAG
jgi:hypothetical protein